MIACNAVEVGNNWNEYKTQVIHEKPLLIKDVQNYLFLSTFEQLEAILDAYQFTARLYHETDGSITLALNEIDLAENADTEEHARLALGASILEYAVDYFNEFKLWNAAPNRKKHLPYVLKALTVNDAKYIGNLLVCQAGSN